MSRCFKEAGEPGARDIYEDEDPRDVLYELLAEIGAIECDVVTMLRILTPGAKGSETATSRVLRFPKVTRREP